MNTGRFSGKWIGMVLTVLFAAGIVAGTAEVLHVLAGVPLPPYPVTAAKANAPGGVQKHVTITLQTFGHAPTEAWMKEHNYHFLRNVAPPLNEHRGWVRYGPTTNLVVPAHALVTIRIENYTNPMLDLNDFYTQPHGVQNNTILVDGKPMTRVPANDISHTFTIHSIPSAKQPWLFVSAPVAALPMKVAMKGADHGFAPHPKVTEFSFVTKGPGDYIWQCFIGCGIGFDGFGGPMSTQGYMSGQFTVTP